MRGPYHEALYGLLLEHFAAKAFTQLSLGKATEKDQTTIGQYLRREKAGTFDLDEAAAALEHIGTSLKDFINNPALVITPRPLQKLSRTKRNLLLAIEELEDEDDLRFVLGAARAVRAKHRASKRSTPKRAAGQPRGVRRTGDTS